PRRGEEVARAVDAYQVGVQERLRVAELEQERTKVRRSEGMKYRPVVVLAAVVWILICGGAGYFIFWGKKPAEPGEGVSTSTKHLAALLAGNEQPKGGAEWFTLARLSRDHRRNHAAAARLYAAAFEDDPSFVASPLTGHRFSAACSAVLAADGQGQDAAGLDDRERSRLRQQALDWLRADLALWKQY